MSTGKLTSTTFISGPKDELAPVDVYQQSGSGVQNSYHSSFHEVSGALDSFLGGLGDALKKGNDFLSNNLNAINSAIAQANSLGRNNNSVLNGLKNNPIQSLTNLVGGTSPALDSLLNTARTANSLYNEANRAANSIKNQTERLDAGLNSLSSSTKPGESKESLGEVLNTSVANYGTLDPTSTTLSDSINKDLDNLFGGDRTVATSLLEPPVNRTSTLINETQFDKDKTNLEVEELLDNLTDTEVIAAISNLTDEAREALVRGCSVDSLYSNNQVAVNGNTGTIDRHVDKRNAEAIGNLVSHLSNGNYEVDNSNKGIDANLITGVVHLASKAGYPDVFQTLTEHQPIEVMREVSKPLLLRANEEGDFDLIKDIANTEIAKDIKSIVPNVVNNLMANIKRPDNLSQQEYANYYKEIKNAFNRIDSNWSKVNTNSVEAINCTGISKNLFFCDLLEAQLNELSSPELNLGNKQIAYPRTGVDNPTRLLNEIALPEPTIRYETSTDAEGLEHVVEIVEEPEPYKKPEILKIDKNQFNDEKFLLLGKVFMNNTVDAELQKHFPYFYITLNKTPIMSIV
jgi:hypothetical protein